MDSGHTLTPRERMLCGALSLVVAASRFFAIAKSLWDWDEALFALALRDYDVAMYHPHPPGFPLFVGVAKLLTLCGIDSFHALQAIVVIASLFVFPAMFFLARELGASFFVACASALTLAFLPNVWFFGGTAFSDVPSMVLALAACALLLRGRTSPRALLLGGLVAGIAVGVRPQNLLFVAVPFVLAFLRRRGATMLAAAIATIIIALSYGGAIIATGGWQPYSEALAHHSDYIRAVDSFLSPIRPPLWKVFDDFFFWPFRAPVINVALLALALIGLARINRIALAIFVPFAIFAWLSLDFHSSSRFSIAYMPLYALLAAHGAELFRRARHAIAAALLALMIVWTWPALRVVHTSDAPPVAACTWIRTHVPRGTTIFVGESLGAHAALLLPDYDVQSVRESDRPRANSWLLTEEGSGFTRPRARLARAITRPRYFEVSVRPAPRPPLHPPGS
ncbi:MAG TPA: hypothetical protein VFN10_02270 [Thermoanaerobaculia bacterium]|nr:hypothetical protein [Thermoanaerobaculia bacterium]